MGRRSFGISATQISRMISAAQSAQKARERQQLINSQAGISTKQAPTYNLTNFDFNLDSRICHVEFLETTKYRKIDRYVTSGGVRHPIYSDWNTKTKTIKKTIKLTNETLERLNHWDDALILGFSYEIVSKIDCEDLYPSWFIIKTLENEMNCDISDCRQPYVKLINEKVADSQSKKELINQTNRRLQDNQKNRDIVCAKLDKLTRKKERAANRKNIALFSVLTFGIYLAFHSKKRINRLTNMISETSNHIEQLNEEKRQLENSVIKYNKHIEKNIQNKKSLEEQRDKKVAAIKDSYAKKISEVEPLPTSFELNEDAGFMPLGKFAGMTYEKIIGCYVIRNIENRKCYVGQSKDVFKRVTRDHFSGTKIKNIIFAEDYYKSSIEDKNNLFEVKVIKCQTKDELDKTEKELIEVYDSFNNGYNSTSGNS